MYTLIGKFIDFLGIIKYIFISLNIKLYLLFDEAHLNDIVLDNSLKKSSYVCDFQ